MKRRFEFRLERVRRVRELEERVVRAERAQAEESARTAEARRDSARALLDRSRLALAELLEGSPAPRNVIAAQRVLDAELAGLRRRTESARTLRTQAERIAAVHRERMSAARALEELRTRARRRHAAELQKLENEELDEIAQRRAEALRREAPGKAEDASRSAPPESDQESRIPSARAP